MSEIQTIANIRDMKNTIKDRIKKINFNTDDEQSFFGQEAQYTYKGLIDVIDALLIDIATLIKAPKHFLKLSTYQERHGIYQSLNNVNQHLEDPNNLFSHLEQLKQKIRPFHIRYTSERLINFDDELSELTENKLKFQQDLEDLKNELVTVTTKKEEAEKLFESLETQHSELQDNIDKSNNKLLELDNSINGTNNNAVHISDIKSQSDSHKEIIDNFVEKIINREQELESQTVKTSDFKKQLENFTTERAKLLETANSLIKEAKTALGYKKAEGISGAFQTQLKERSGGGWWVVGIWCRYFYTNCNSFNRWVYLS